MAAAADCGLRHGATSGWRCNATVHRRRLRKRMDVAWATLGTCSAHQVEIVMHTLTTDELERQPQQFIDAARRGEPTIVTIAGEPILMAFPLGKGVDARALLIDLAATLFDGQQISLGLAAQLAGLAYSEMVDELGRRGIATIRLDAGDLQRELPAFGQ